MKFPSAILASVLLLAGQSLAESCKTCRGSDCMADNLFELDCTKFVPALPFESQLISENTGETSEYGCLDLEYYVGDSLDQIQQCVMSSNLESYCDMLGNNLKIEACSVEPLGAVRSVRSAEQEELSADETTDPDSTSTTETSTTTASGGIHLVSLTSLLTVIAALLM